MIDPITGALIAAAAAVGAGAMWSYQRTRNLPKEPVTLSHPIAPCHVCDEDAVTYDELHNIWVCAKHNRVDQGKTPKQPLPDTDPFDDLDDDVSLPWPPQSSASQRLPHTQYSSPPVRQPRTQPKVQRSPSQPSPRHRQSPTRRQAASSQRSTPPKKRPQPSWANVVVCPRCEDDAQLISQKPEYECPDCGLTFTLVPGPGGGLVPQEVQ